MITNSIPSLPCSVSSGLNLPDQTTAQSSLVTAATGLGKTVIMGMLAGSWPVGRVMMISHRFELNQQAIKSFERIANCHVDLEQASYRADQRFEKSHIVVASVQTLTSKAKGRYRMERFDPAEFGLLMIDEAHRAAAASYRRVVDYFRSENPAIKIVGVTATPDRLDRVGLGCVFDTVVGKLDILWGIEHGWLVPVEQKFVRVDGLDLSQVKTTGGDLDEKQLARVLEIEQNLHAMAEPIVDVCGDDKQAIVFAASVQQSKRLAELIRDYITRKTGSECDLTRAIHLDGSLDPMHPARRQVVSDFKNGRIQFLVNCSVATEGFDAPGVKVIAIGRPTKSRALYVQMLGRGTRPLPGVVDGVLTPTDRRAAIAASAKQSMTVLDFVGQAGRHNLVCSADVLFGESQPAAIVERVKQITRQSIGKDQLEALEQAKEEARLAAEARRARLTAKTDYQLVDVKGGYDLDQIPKVKCPGYMIHRGPSDKQRAMLVKLGFNPVQIDKMNPRSASAAIDYAIRNPRTGFGRWLKAQKEKEVV